MTKDIDTLRGRSKANIPARLNQGAVKKRISESDPVNPNHYKAKLGFQAIDVIEEATRGAPTGFAGVLQGNAIKYLYRLWRKENALQDAKKSRWYLDKLIEELEKEDK